MRYTFTSGIVAMATLFAPSVLGTMIRSTLYGTYAAAHEEGDLIKFVRDDEGDTPMTDPMWDLEQRGIEDFWIVHEATGLYVNCDGQRDAPFKGAICDLGPDPTTFNFVGTSEDAEYFSIIVAGTDLSWGLNSQTGALVLKQAWRPQSFELM